MQKNRFEVAGHLAGRPETRYLPSGTKVANARLGETYRYTGPDNQVHAQTNWHSLVFYAQLADVASAYEKGDNLFVEGVLQQRKFTPKDGVARTVYEVVVKSCHRIADRERETAGVDAPTNGLSILSNTISELEVHDDTWPV
jgi:single-strand DNA-binding protein